MTASKMLVCAAVTLSLASCDSPEDTPMNSVEQDAVICQRDNMNAGDHALVRRYDELVSLWIEKFKQYPSDALSSIMQGDAVVRIRFDRDGNITSNILERSTGYGLLDQAAVDTVKRANPVPAVPSDYPPCDLIEMTIPVKFRVRGR